MAQNHEDGAAELHAIIQDRVPDKRASVDMTGGSLPLNEKSHMTDVEEQPTEEGQEPTEHEKKTLRRIGDKFPMSAYLVAVVELCERFTYYGCQGLFQNYINNNPNGADGARGLGLGHAGATGLNTFFQFFCYITPILGAIISDQYLGKYKTILIFAGVYVLGLLILWTTALPASLDAGAGLGGYVTAIIVIGFGTGGIKSNIAPLIADQYTRKVMAVSTIPKTGERVIIDPAITYQRIYMVFYLCINVGCLSLLATPFMEKYKGFWTAYLFCFCTFCLGVVVLIVCRGKYIIRPPQGSIITDSFKALGMMIAARNMDAAKPSWRANNGKNTTVPWNDHFIDELKRALRACKVFCFYPIFWVCYNQFSGNFVSQAAQMNGHGMPNDLMQNFDPISIIVVIPILDRVVYPLLRKANIELKPIRRITIGFVLAGLCLAYAAIVQHIIYGAGPCYGKPLHCPAGIAADGLTKIPNNIHIAVQTPAYFLIGVSEIFISVTGLEYAYTKAPPTMKSFVQSMYLFTTAVGAALSEALVPATGDPAIMWMYTGVGIAAVLVGGIFWFIFHHYDDEEEEMNKLDMHDTWGGKPGEESDGEESTPSAHRTQAHPTTSL
ncbi:peptide transporter ptr2 [Elasticomyces elasticus]|uniref:Peptide transporter ptr2 n=1 Tax=Elasticomyces elasticus TaxID=574655 RepID=A0AAN7W137_9PEZI|nr:peptide transporter ptr2 [Elasticomyces elasticus]KAK4970035.1 peptide transporter ptr2 [Elasticomyces elasticus]KAK5693629.1 peptide transporter ptr2 [Elasticomyces elasticus]KAK5719957.1 peptide transporter ptr2 [Elasticomyces elasticus]